MYWLKYTLYRVTIVFIEPLLLPYLLSLKLPMYWLKLILIRYQLPLYDLNILSFSYHTIDILNIPLVTYDFYNIYSL